MYRPHHGEVLAAPALTEPHNLCPRASHVPHNLCPRASYLLSTRGGLVVSRVGGYAHARLAQFTTQKEPNLLHITLNLLHRTIFTSNIKAIVW